MVAVQNVLVSLAKACIIATPAKMVHVSFYLSRMDPKHQASHQPVSVLGKGI